MGPGLPGTVVEVTLDDGRTLRREAHSGSSYLGGEDPRVHFGLGAKTHISELTVRWPDGTTTTAADLPVGQLFIPAR